MRGAHITLVTNSIRFAGGRIEVGWPSRIVENDPFRRFFAADLDLDRLHYNWRRCRVEPTTPRPIYQ